MSVTGSRAFRPEHRIQRSLDYSLVFKCPVRVSTGTFTLLARANGRSTARLGLAVAKRQVGSAVARHHIKRIVREWFRQVRTDLPPCDIIFLCRANITRMSNIELTQNLGRQLNRLSQLCERSSSP